MSVLLNRAPAGRAGCSDSAGSEPSVAGAGSAGWGSVLACSIPTRSAHGSDAVRAEKPTGRDRPSSICLSCGGAGCALHSGAALHCGGRSNLPAASGTVRKRSARVVFRPSFSSSAFGSCAPAAVVFFVRCPAGASSEPARLQIDSHRLTPLSSSPHAGPSPVPAAGGAGAGERAARRRMPGIGSAVTPPLLADSLPTVNRLSFHVNGGDAAIPPVLRVLIWNSPLDPACSILVPPSRKGLQIPAISIWPRSC